MLRQSDRIVLILSKCVMSVIIFGVIYDVKYAM